jgi:NADH:ubiquinone oxidoreductase subunit 6 (subunit J)
MQTHAVLFWIIAVVTGASAITVVVTQNIVRAATWLLFALAGTAGVFFLLGADFVGATQLLVYVGGTLVLVVFGVMLTAQGPFITIKTGAAEWVIGTVAGLLLYAVLAISILSRDSGLATRAAASPVASNPKVGYTAELGAALLGIEQITPPAKLPGVPDRQRRQVSYLLPFEIVSVHLLVVLIGAAYLARAKRRREAAT